MINDVMIILTKQHQVTFTSRDQIRTGETTQTIIKQIPTVSGW